MRMKAVMYASASIVGLHLHREKYHDARCGLQANAAAEGRSNEVNAASVQTPPGSTHSQQQGPAMHGSGAGQAIRPIPYGLTPQQQQQQQQLILQQQFTMQQQQQLLMQQQVCAATLAFWQIVLVRC